MNKNALYIIAVLAIAASIAMKVMARNGRTTELANYWWIPLPLALICLIAAEAKKKK
jgi:hypothetical protein